MLQVVTRFLQEKNLFSHLNEEILIVTATKDAGIELCKDLLSLVVEPRTLLLLSGGRTPLELYAKIARDEIIIPGAVGQIDERYGQPFHAISNQKLIEEVGLLRYFQMRDIPFYPMLTSQSREKSAELYDTLVRELMTVYTRTVGIVGIGLDGHTAGLPANAEVWKEYNLEKRSRTEYVIDYDDHGGFYKERVSMSFSGLSLIDLLIVLVFGDDKKKALDLVFSEGKESEIPGRFYKRPEIAKKTIIITDQMI